MNKYVDIFLLIFSVNRVDGEILFFDFPILNGKMVYGTGVCRNKYQKTKHEINLNTKTKYNLKYETRYTRPKTRKFTKYEKRNWHTPDMEMYFSVFPVNIFSPPFLIKPFFLYYFLTFIFFQNPHKLSTTCVEQPQCKKTQKNIQNKNHSAFNIFYKIYTNYQNLSNYL